ncbi:cupin domain-containing protein [Pelagicoccus sp. SDUM812003]|uniref:cupin domain-containing protein n=1 Tax=Pelagicoccus sp. SDUM812003 TaxID=3041267 RepID=UPI00280D4FD9|nr:cupin domain-containing protein [Pelagicoccus sp. SDUM812003]MDQ8204094.1 cupin domain-containing protein [Pelagicoccus sp. SDUM812003]
MSDTNEVMVRRAESFPLEKVGAGAGTCRSVMISSEQAPHFALRRFVMEPGGGMPLHTNTVEHEQYILKGSAEVVIGETVYQISEGDVVYIPAGVPHSYKADAEKGFEFLCMVPNKQDVIEIVEPGC